MIVIIDISKTLKVEIKILEKSRLAFSSELPSFIKDGGVMTPNWIWKNLATRWKIEKTWVKAIETGWFEIWWCFFGDVLLLETSTVVFFLTQTSQRFHPKNIGSFYYWIFLYFLFARLDILSCSLWKFSKSEFCTFPKLWASLQTEAWVWAKQRRVAQWSYHAKLAPDGHEAALCRAYVDATRGPFFVRWFPFMFVWSQRGLTNLGIETLERFRPDKE